MSKMTWWDELKHWLAYHIFWRVICPFGFHRSWEVTVAETEEGVYRLDVCMRCGRTTWKHIADYIVRDNEGKDHYYFGVGDEFDE